MLYNLITNLYLSPVFLFLLSTLPIIKPTVLLSPITIKSSLALVIPVYNKLRVKSIGAALGIHIITTSNSLPLILMNRYTITMFNLLQICKLVPSNFIIIKLNFYILFFFIYIQNRSKLAIKYPCSCFIT